ncbi:MAG: hypothetical protein KGM43_03290 [Planctomycetota bacterium]|nr:hypothetical protein [Planctomycetota bacterium]
MRGLLRALRALPLLMAGLVACPWSAALAVRDDGPGLDAGSVLRRAAGRCGRPLGSGKLKPIALAADASDYDDTDDADLNAGSAATPAFDFAMISPRGALPEAFDVDHAALPASSGGLARLGVCRLRC